jgi:hypothetical protein
VCVGKSADPALGYDWAIVTAGAPAHRLLNGKCRTGDALGNYQGESALGFRFGRDSRSCQCVCVSGRVTGVLLGRGKAGAHCWQLHACVATGVQDKTGCEICICALSCPGVWLYSRKPVDPEGTATMRGVAESLNLDISNLKPVTQVGRPSAWSLHTCMHACKRLC